jgi:hypothetical protein
LRRGPFLTSLLAPRVELCALGGMVHPFVHPRGEHFLLFRRMESLTEFHTQGITPPPQGTKFTRGEKRRPWGSKFAPRGEVKYGPQGLGARSFYFHLFSYYSSAEPQWLHQGLVFILKMFCWPMPLFLAIKHICRQCTLSHYTYVCTQQHCCVERSVSCCPA